MAELKMYPLTVTPYAIARTDDFLAKANKAKCINSIITCADEVDLTELPPKHETSVPDDVKLTTSTEVWKGFMSKWQHELGDVHSFGVQVQTKKGQLLGGAFHFLKGY